MWTPTTVTISANALVEKKRFLTAQWQFGNVVAVSARFGKALLWGVTDRRMASSILQYLAE